MHVRPKSHVLDEDIGPYLSRERTFFWGGHVPAIVAYLRGANGPAQHTRQRNAFAAAIDKKTAMRLFAMLLWTLVYFSM